MSKPSKLPEVRRVRGLAQCVARWVRRGLPITPPADFQHRAETCAPCPQVKVNRAGELAGCRLCGCCKWKLYLATAECPDNPPRWGAVSACVI